MVRRLTGALAIAACCAAPAVLTALGGRPARPRPAPTDAALMPLVARIGDRVRSYHERLAAISATETVTQTPLDGRFQPRGRAREFVYDLIITRIDGPNGTPDIRAQRQLRLVDGRAPRKHDEPACTDPQPEYEDPLSFLLPEMQPQFRFEAVNADGEDDEVLHFEQLASERVRVDWKNEHCFSADGGRIAGDLRLDRATNDVLRVDTHLAEPFPVLSRTPLADGGRFIVFEKWETAVRLKHVSFDNPDEVLLLPESIVTRTSVRGAATPRMENAQRFSNYRRFMTEAKIKGE